MVGLVVAPESSKSHPAIQFLLLSRSVVFFEVLKDRWVVDAVLDHVVENVGHSVKGQIVPLLVVAVVDVHLDAAIDVFGIVVKEERVLRVVSPAALAKT